MNSLRYVARQTRSMPCEGIQHWMWVSVTSSSLLSSEDSCTRRLSLRLVIVVTLRVSRLKIAKSGKA